MLLVPVVQFNLGYSLFCRSSILPSSQTELSFFTVLLQLRLSVFKQRSLMLLHYIVTVNIGPFEDSPTFND